MGPTVLTDILSEVVVLGAYSVTTATFASDTARSTLYCSTHSGVPLPIDPPLTFSRPADVDTRQKLLPYEAASSLATSLGYNACNVTVNAVNTPSPTLASSAVISTTPNTQSSATNTTSDSHTVKTHLSVQAKLSIGVVIPLVAIITCLLIALFCFRQRLRKLSSSKEKTPLASNGDAAYLQQKGELDAKERRKYELHAGRIHYELGGDEIHEIATDGDRCEFPTSWRPELRGEEHCKEL